MGFLGIFGMSNKGNGKDLPRNRKYYIVDGHTLESAKGERTRMNPRSQIDLLRKVARFVKKENTQMCVILEGKVLRDAPDNKKFQEVLVCYAATGNGVPKLVEKVCDQKSNLQVLVITGDKNVERAAGEKGASVMHSSTFLKALGGNNAGGGKGEKKSGQRRRPKKKQEQNQGEKKHPDQQKQQQKQTPKPKKEKETDPVSDLIDLC